MSRKGKSFSVGFHADDRGGKGGNSNNYNPDSIVRANSGTHQLHSPEIALLKFISMHGNDRNREHSFTVGEDGFVYGYSHGNESSVVPAGPTQGKLLYHNHPSGASFSGKDLLAMALHRSKGVVVHAVGKGSHVLIVNDLNRFTRKRAEWMEAVKKASWPKRMSYDRGVAYWLNQNARTFGIKYFFIPLKRTRRTV